MTKKKRAVAKQETGPRQNEEASLPSLFPIVGLGASAGGLAAFEAFFSAMPPDTDTDMAFVLVQHLAPDHKSILTDLVKRYTRMQVLEAEALAMNSRSRIPENRLYGERHDGKQII